MTDATRDLDSAAAARPRTGTLAHLDGAAAADDEPCPKCKRALRPDETACARCGLLAANFAGFSAPPEFPELDAPWLLCRASWEDARRHDALIDLAASFGALPSLARRYREVVESQPADPVAGRRIAQIAVYIETALRAQARSESSPRSSRVVWLLGYAVAASVLIASAWMFLVAFTHPH